jgi:hypothetical protein
MSDLNTESTSNALKNYIQNKSIDLWETKANFYGYALITMGVGKSKIIADAIKKLLSDPYRKSEIEKADLPIVILVNSTILRDVELPSELEKWGCLYPVKITCYQTAYRWKDKSIGALFSDEMDFAVAETRSYLKAFTNNTFKYFFGLTGTLIPDKVVQTIEVFETPPFYVYDMKEAHRDLLINPIKIWVHEVELSDEKYPEAPYGETTKYKWIANKIEDCKNQISYLFDQLRGTRDYDEKELIKEKIDFLKKSKGYWEFSPRNKNSRIEFLRTAKSLTDYARNLKTDILNHKESNKVILFSQLKKSGYLISDHTYFEGEEASVFDRFNEGVIRELAVVKKVNRGVNFKKLNHCIVQSFNSSITEAKQGYLGRMVRLPSDETAHVHFLISYYYERGEKMYCHNTMWLKEVLEDSELSHIEKVLYEK